MYVQFLQEYGILKFLQPNTDSIRFYHDSTMFNIQQARIMQKNVIKYVKYEFFLEKHHYLILPFFDHHSLVVQLPL